MSLAFTRTNFITGSYASDLIFLLQVRENKPLRLKSIRSPNTQSPVQTDPTGRAVIGYGYDLAANAATAISDLTAAGATINNSAMLTSAIDALPAVGAATAAEIEAVSAQVSLPTSASALSLLQEAISPRETSFNSILGTFGLPIEPNREEQFSPPPAVQHLFVE